MPRESAARRAGDSIPACMISARGCRSAKYPASSSIPRAGFSGAQTALVDDGENRYRQLRTIRQYHNDPVTTAYPDTPQCAPQFFDVLIEAAVG